MIFIEILIKILIGLAVLVLFLLHDNIGHDEFSRYKKMKDRTGFICYMTIIFGFIALWLI